MFCHCLTLGYSCLDEGIILVIPQCLRRKCCRRILARPVLTGGELSPMRLVEFKEAWIGERWPICTTIPNFASPVALICVQSGTRFHHLPRHPKNLSEILRYVGPVCKICARLLVAEQTLYNLEVCKDVLLFTIERGHTKTSPSLCST